MFEEPPLFILFYFSILFFFAFRDLERAEILSRHSNREELKLLPRRNQGLECAYNARITKKKKNSSASCHFKTYHTGLILCLYIGDCFDITQGCNQQISSTATLYF